MTTDSTPGPTQEYVIARIRTVLSTDPRIAKQDVRVSISGDCIHLTGDATTEERRERVGELVAELFPAMRVCNELSVIRIGIPGKAERLP